MGKAEHRLKEASDFQIHLVCCARYQRADIFSVSDWLVFRLLQRFAVAMLFIASPQYLLEAYIRGVACAIV